MNARFHKQVKIATHLRNYAHLSSNVHYLAHTYYLKLGYSITNKDNLTV